MCAILVERCLPHPLLYVRADDIRRDSVVKSYPPTTPLSYSTPRTPKGERDKITLDTRTTFFYYAETDIPKESERDMEKAFLSLSLSPLLSSFIFSFPQSLPERAERRDVVRKFPFESRQCVSLAMREGFILLLFLALASGLELGGGSGRGRFGSRDRKRV